MTALGPDTWLVNQREARIRHNREVMASLGLGPDGCFSLPDLAEQRPPRAVKRRRRHAAEHPLPRRSGLRSQATPTPGATAASVSPVGSQLPGRAPSQQEERRDC